MSGASYDKAAHDTIVSVLRRDPDLLIHWAAERLAVLGSKAEWSMDDNFETTEGLAALASEYRLPAATDQDADGLAFYGAAARHLGHNVEG